MELQHLLEISGFRFGCDWKSECPAPSNLPLLPPQGTDGAEGAEGSDEAAATSWKFNGAFLGKGFGVIIHYLNVDPNQYIDQYSNIFQYHCYLYIPAIQL